MMNRIVARRDFVKMGLLAGATMTTGGLLSACASNGEGAASQSADGLGVGSSSGANQAVQADPATPPQPVGGKVLVAYYSAQGHTRAVAERIAAATGGDIFEITPENPYSDADLDWRDDNSRVTREHDDQSLRDIVLSQVTPDALRNTKRCSLVIPSGGRWLHGQLTVSCATMTSCVRRLSRFAPRPRHRWAQPVRRSSSLPVRVSGLMVSVLAKTRKMAWLKTGSNR